MTVLYPIIVFSAIVNSIIFSGDYGPLQQDLIFMIPQRFWPTFSQFLLNSFVLLALIIFTLFVLKKKITIIKTINILILISFTLTILVSFIKINKTYKNLPVPVVQNQIEPIYHLSKDKQNVIFIMKIALHQ